MEAARVRYRKACRATAGVARGGLAARGPGGRLVYSTCSLEQEENEEVVEAFLRAAGGRFVLEQTRSSRPWEDGCDGAGAFLLRNRSVRTSSASAFNGSRHLG